LIIQKVIILEIEARTNDDLEDMLIYFDFFHFGDFNKRQTRKKGKTSTNDEACLKHLASNLTIHKVIILDIKAKTNEELDLLIYFYCFHVGDFDKQ
jgi:hypothetical protein